MQLSSVSPSSNDTNDDEAREPDEGGDTTGDGERGLDDMASLAVVLCS